MASPARAIAPRCMREARQAKGKGDPIALGGEDGNEAINVSAKTRPDVTEAALA
ncbi:hypothetical protein JOH51_001644 [Rhizobium leguminosarum]|nr:hypothetical protein [Rhizobium leguminosarum]